MSQNNKKSNAATYFGALTSVAVAFAVIDIDAIQLNTYTDYIKLGFKLFVIGMPALGGYYSQLK